MVMIATEQTKKILDNLIQKNLKKNFNFSKKWEIITSNRKIKE